MRKFHNIVLVAVLWLVVSGPTNANEREIQDCPNCPKLVKVPKGTFTMGSDGGDATEAPAHEVTIAKHFAIGKYEVTVGEWSACVEAGACSYKFSKKHGNGPNFPMRNVSWLDAQEYVQWLSTVSGKPYRLPSEAEWEYATRGGTDTKFWWGEEVGTGKANCKDCGGVWERKFPAEVNGFPANPFGLHGTSGGVWEWSDDCWFKNHEGAAVDGRSRVEQNCPTRVLRGGAWRNNQSYARSASRFKYDTDVRYALNGFRVARDID